MKTPDNSTSLTDIKESLACIKNDLHQKQELFIAQKAYADALENAPASEDTSPEALNARKKLEQAKVTFENLDKLVNGPPPVSPS